MSEPDYARAKYPSHPGPSDTARISVPGEPGFTRSVLSQICPRVELALGLPSPRLELTLGPGSSHSSLCPHLELALGFLSQSSLLRSDSAFSSRPPTLSLPSPLVLQLSLSCFLSSLRTLARPVSVFWVRPHTRGCSSRCFRSRTVSTTVAKWFVPIARGTVDKVYRFGPLRDA
jgi:hypothetical protein